MKTKINGTTYELHPLTRGAVRLIGELKGEEQLDAMVRMSLDIVDVDQLPMADFMQLVDAAIKYNCLDQNAIKDAKKN